MSKIIEARGHFDLQLNIKSCHNKRSIKYRIQTLEFYLSDDYSLQSAIGNLLGVLYFYLGQYHEAYVRFTRVLRDDQNNLNALENLRFVCHRLMNLKDAEKYSQRREAVLNNADAMTRVRFKAEHAYAHAFEVYGATDELRRYCESNDIYDECLNGKTNLEDQNIKLERAGWLMCKIWNFKKLFNRNFKKDDSKRKNEEIYPVILGILFDIQDLVPDDSFLNSLAWGYLGYFFWKKPISPGHGQCSAERQQVPTPEIVADRGIGHLFNDPEQCFLKALKIREGIEVLQLYTGWLLEEKKFELGINNLTRCIELNQTEGNYFSYSKRGELLLAKCNKASRNNNSQLESDIEQAISDFEFAATADPSSYIFGYLGECYCLASGGGENEIYKSKCLAAFQCGLDCLDGKRDTWLHFKHAKCLKEFGEDDLALGAVQRSVENQYPNTTFVEDVKFLLKWYIEKFCAADSKLADAANASAQDIIIPEAGFWFYTAFSRYMRPQFNEMVKTLMNGPTGQIDFFTKLFGFLWNKNYPGINQFLLDLSRNYKNSHGNISMFELQDVLSASLKDEKTIVKRSNDLRPRNREGYDFDFFVIYSHHDKNWVLYNLLAHLEQNYDFKGYIDDRDFHPGKYILKNIEDAIDKCFKFIIVITPAFADSSWCNHETQSAFTDALIKKKTGAIIPIVMDGAKSPDFLNSIIHLNMTIEHRDFERLVMALDN